MFQQFLARYRTYRGKYKTVLVSHYTDPLFQNLWF
jgi:hypothetical protein